MVAPTLPASDNSYRKPEEAAEGKNAGIPQRVVDTWLGHQSDKSMGSVYYKLSDEDSQKFMLNVPLGTGKSAADAEKRST